MVELPMTLTLITQIHIFTLWIFIRMSGIAVAIIFTFVIQIMA